MTTELLTPRLASIIDVPTLQESQMLFALLERDLRGVVGDGCTDSQSMIRIQQTLFSLIALWRDASDHALSAHMQSFSGYLIRCLENVRQNRCRYTAENMRHLAQEVHTAWDPILQCESDAPCQSRSPGASSDQAWLNDPAGTRESPRAAAASSSKT